MEKIKLTVMTKKLNTSSKLNRKKDKKTRNLESKEEKQNKNKTGSFVQSFQKKKRKTEN